MPAPILKKLTPKQEAFKDYYCSNGYNGVQAARVAEYKGNDATLRAVASENLTKPNIKAAISEYIKERQKKCAFNREQSELELVNAQQRAIDKGDIASEIAAIREKNTIFALRTENIITTSEQQREFSERESAELKELAKLRMEAEIRSHSIKLKQG